MRTLLDKCFIAGWDHWAGAAIASKLAVGQAVQLVREPQNEHDENAIAVYVLLDVGLKTPAKMFKLGFVPRTSNGALAYLMDLGTDLGLKAQIVELDANAKNPWKKCAISCEALWENSDAA